MTTTTIRPTVRPSVLERIRPWWLWIVTALAFPPAGYIAHQLFGRVDGVGAALLSGVLTGALIGLAQWALLRRRGGFAWLDRRHRRRVRRRPGRRCGARRLRDIARRAGRDGRRMRGCHRARPGRPASLRCVATPSRGRSPPAAMWATGWAVTTRRRHQGRRPVAGVRDLRCARRRRPAERADQPPRARRRRPNREVATVG